MTCKPTPLPPIPTSEPEQRGFITDVAGEPEVRMDFAIADGPFQPTWESIDQHHPGEPAWWRQGKLGVFIHWGPQAAGRAGDWYARNLYNENWAGRAEFVRRFGHPSETGYKDVLPTWTAPEWDPALLARSFADAGFRYALVQGVHHDNFDLWDSTYQPWNAAQIGPKRDLLEGWRRELKACGMRVGVAFHHEYTWWWWQRAFGSDTKGPFAGRPYDANLTCADGAGTWWEGLDPQLLYGIPLGYSGLTDSDGKPFAVWDIPFYEQRKGLFGNHRAYGFWHATQWALRIRDVIDRYEPDFIYTDGNGAYPFCGFLSGSGYKCDAAARIIAHFYNRAAGRGDLAEKTALIKFIPPNRGAGSTFEGTLPPGVLAERQWTADNCVGDWYWEPGICYDPVIVVRQLLEVVSRDGNLTLCVSITPEGALDAGSRQMLADLGEWMRVHGPGIYGSRAWTTWGEGDPAPGGGIRVLPDGKLGRTHAEFPFSARDMRFTLGADEALYVWLLAWPEDGTALITSLAPGKGLWQGGIGTVQLLGNDAPLAWSLGQAGLEVRLPQRPAGGLAYGLRIQRA